VDERPVTKKSLVADLARLKKQLDARKDDLAKQLDTADKLAALCERALGMVPEPEKALKAAKAANRPADGGA
jgi:hypothetical protein